MVYDTEIFSLDYAKGDASVGAVQEMERRYGDFRQYVAAALDQGDAATLPQLARRFRKESQRTQQAQDVPRTAGSAVAGAHKGFDALIDECRGCALLSCHERAVEHTNAMC